MVIKEVPNQIGQQLINLADVTYLESEPMAKVMKIKIEMRTESRLFGAVVVTHCKTVWYTIHY